MFYLLAIGRLFGYSNQLPEKHQFDSKLMQIAIKFKNLTVNFLK